MTHRVAVLVYMSVAAVAQATPLLSSQAAKSPDPKELAAVERIRARIEEQGKKTAAATPAAYKVTIPNTTFSYGMAPIPAGEFVMGDRKSTRLNSSHLVISYAVFCLKKK